MSDDKSLELLGWIVIGLFAVIVIVAEIIRFENRQKRRKPNIRVPRETLWTRTNRYFGDTE